MSAGDEAWTLTDGDRLIQLDAAAVDPHPDDHRQLVGSTERKPSEPYVLAPGTHVAVIAEPGPDGVYRAPQHGPRLFAAAHSDEIVANAKRGSAFMSRLALGLGAPGVALVVLGLLLG